jgi:phenylacetate-CoA ligase
MYNHWSKLGYDYRNTKIVTFRGLEFNGKIHKYNPLYNEIVLSPFKLSDEIIGKYTNIINKYKPEYIQGYVSAIYNFCRILERNKVDLTVKIKGVFFISENVDPSEKEYIESFFKCKSLAFYGHSERAVFAQEINNSYTFSNLYGYTELHNLESNLRIVCTGFLNRKMPLIRYLTDDYVINNSSKMNIIGHWDKELMIGKSDEKIAMSFINFHTDVFKKIRTFQFEQFERGKVILKIVKDDEITKDDLKLMKIALNKKLLNILDIEIKIVPEIQLTSMGKHKKVIQHVS